eukprot:751456-Hanusia_phi.AAC.3
MEAFRDEHEYNVMRYAMIRLACKDTIDERLSEDDGDLANLIVNHLDSDPKTVANTFCKPICAGSKKQEEL